MMAKTVLADNGRTLSVRIPMAMKRRCGRKVIITPDEDAPALGVRRRQVNTALVKALARAHRWERLLKTGRFATIGDLARAENTNPSYLARVLRLTLLAPDIVEGALDGRQPEGMTLAGLMTGVPMEWTAQAR